MKRSTSFKMISKLTILVSVMVGCQQTPVADNQQQFQPGSGDVNINNTYPDYDDSSYDPEFNSTSTYCSVSSCPTVELFANVVEGEAEDQFTLSVKTNESNSWKISVTSEEDSSRTLRMFVIDRPSNMQDAPASNDGRTGATKLINYRPTSRNSSAQLNILMRDMTKCEFEAEKADKDIAICRDENKRELNLYDSVRSFTFEFRLSDDELRECVEEHQKDQGISVLLGGLLGGVNPTLGNLYQAYDVLKGQGLDCDDDF